MIFQSDRSGKVDISPGALSRLKELAEKFQDRETGGILVGFNHGKNIVVTAVSDPGPNATQSQTHFLRDTDHCRNFLQHEYEKSGADYVGEWHSHVVPLDRLSMGDVQTLAGIFVDPDYDFETFAVALVVMKAEGAELQVYVVERMKHRGHAGMRVIELYRGRFPEPKTTELEPGKPSSP